MAIIQTFKMLFFINVKTKYNFWKKKTEGNLKMTKNQLKKNNNNTFIIYIGTFSDELIISESIKFNLILPFNQKSFYVLKSKTITTYII